MTHALDELDELGELGDLDLDLDTIAANLAGLRATLATEQTS